MKSSASRPRGGRALCVVAAVLAFAAPASTSSGQPARPVPYPVIPPAFFDEAVSSGTRTETGEPGPAYWMNETAYVLEASLRPDENLLFGSGTVRYTNRSPEVLRALYLHLRQNLTRPESQRNWPIGETTSGMELREVRVDGLPVAERSTQSGGGYAVQGTIMRIELPSSVPPGNTVEVSFSWQFEIPQGAPRLGHDGGAYFLGHWYPQIAVYDDLRGWDAEQYRGMGEFYMPFADFDVSIRAPEGWLVAATGTLENPEAVLTPRVRDRLAEAAAARDTAVVRIVDVHERGSGRATIDAGGDSLTWRFRAERVRDFAFGASADYVWDAVATVVGEAAESAEPDTVLVHALYRPEYGMWESAAEFARFGVDFLSDLYLPYPYPQMSIVEGPFPFGGIEYPMITLIGGAVWSPRAMFEIVVHEVAHSWWPMVVGSNEKRYMWQDEGLTHFATQQAGRAYYVGWRSFNPDEYYMEAAGDETPIMRHADSFPSISELLVSIYMKPNVGFGILGGLYGQERLVEALRIYTRRWAFRHPTPWDFFNTIEDVLGEDLDWFWSAWFYENWTVDQAIEGVEREERGVIVVVRDDGLAPMPVPVEVTYVGGQASRQTLSVSPWLAGNRVAHMLFPAGDVVRVEIDPQQFMPDVDRSDNVWEAN